MSTERLFCELENYSCHEMFNSKAIACLISTVVATLGTISTCVSYILLFLIFFITKHVDRL